MSANTHGLLDGFRHMLGQLSGRHHTPPHPGQRELQSLAQALSAQALALSDVVFGRLSADAGALDGMRDGSESRAQFGAQSSAQDSAQISVQRALAACLVGQRSIALSRAPASLAGLREVLCEGARRGLPGVLVAAVPARGDGALAGHAPLWSVAGDAPLCLVPATAQSALDGLLVLLRACEFSLWPGLLALDAGMLYAPASLWTPDPGLRARFLGDSHHLIETPTAAQAQRFGAKRPAVPVVCDPSAPAGLFQPLSPDALDAAAFTRSHAVVDHQPALVRSARELYAALTGRDQPALLRHGPAHAPCVLLTAGSAFETACAAVERAPSRRARVVGIEWVSPFPSDALWSELAGAARVLVLERGQPGLSGGLADAVRRCLFDAASQPAASHLGGTRGAPLPVLHSVTFGPVRERPALSDLLALLQRAADGELAGSTHLGVRFADSADAHPDRRAMLERFERAHPAATAHGLAAVDVAAQPGWALLACEPDAEALALRLAQQLGAGEGAPTISATALAQRSVCLHVGAEAGGEGASSGLVIASDELSAFEAALARVQPGGWVLSARPEPSPSERSPSERSPAELLTSWPLACRQLAHARGLRLWQAPAGRGFSDLVATAAALAAGDTRGCEPVPMAAPPTAANAPSVAPTANAALARFWGELGHARWAEPGHAAVPEPHLLHADSPAGSAALAPAARVPARVPVIDGSACTGCGHCWTACPDGALVARALPTERRLRAALDACAPLASRASSVATLARGLGPLAAALDKRLHAEQRRVLDGDLLAQTAEPLLVRLGPSDAETAPARAALAGVGKSLSALPALATPALFHAPDAGAERALLMLARDPNACQACGLCEAQCPEGAIRMQPADAQALRPMAAEMAELSQLPEPAPGWLSSLAARAEPGPAAACLMDAAAAGAVARMPAGRASEAGSGLLLSARLIAAALTTVQRERRAQLAAETRAACEALQKAVRAQVSQALPFDDVAALAHAAERTPAHADNFDALVADLRAQGKRLSLDAPVFDRRVQLLHAMGASHVPSAPFGPLVIAHGALGDGLAHPDNPFQVPVCHAPPAAALPMAEALARAALSQAEERVRDLRAARLLASPPSNLLSALDEGARAPLSESERVAIEPVSLWLGADGLAEIGVAPVLHALASRLPLCIVVIDDGALRDRLAGLLSLLALADGQACVLSSAVSRPDPLVAGLRHALATGRPTLVHLLSPRPRALALAPGDMLKQAEARVTRGEHPIYCATIDAPLTIDVAPRLEPFARLLQALLPKAQAAESDTEPETSAQAPVAPSAPDLSALRTELTADHIERLHKRLLALAGLSDDGGAA